MLDLTLDMLSRRPLPKSIKGDPRAIANWISSIVPCMASGHSQSARDTSLIISALSREPIEVIDRALAMTGYAWDFSEPPIFYARAKQMRAMANPSKHATMGPAKPIDPTWAKMRAEQLNTLYLANQHNPEFQKRLAEALLDLLMQAGNGFNKMRQDKDKLQRVQEEIMNTARELNGHVYRVSRGELARMRLPAPPPGNVRVIMPPPTPRGR